MKHLTAKSLPPLTEAEIERYARQIIMPEVGAAGQQRLLASRITVPGPSPQAVAARLYLRAAGVQVVEDAGQTSDAVAIGTRGDLSESEMKRIQAEGRPVFRSPVVVTGTVGETEALAAAAGAELAAAVAAYLLGWTPQVRTEGPLV